MTVLFVMAVFVLSAPASAEYYATELVSYSASLTASGLYDDPTAVLGAPSTNFANTWGSNPTARVKLVEPAYNTDLEGNNLITTLNANQEIVVGFDHQVENDPNNPYGIDFLVFGNSFYTGNGTVSDDTNMNDYLLSGGSTFNGAGWFEDVLVSVSQGAVEEGMDPNDPDTWDWYTYIDGPYGDNAYPTQAYLWDAENAEWTDTLSDFTKPVDPDAIDELIGETGVSAADAIAAYDGSGGGTGFDLDDLYDLYGVELDWIQYIKVEGTSEFAGGEIDAFTDVAAVPVPAAVWLLASGLLGLAGLRKRSGC
ncbi:hypothetical protein DSCO28_70900 [Desulfosarcina ovata subsp. sediminis]|uniref:PEP-CTERM protein-sorting domain-containing protein n=2 Tax=Desulfosarcina ovata TaxID=83564 RepID=A0A5K8A2H0_9BACT|nr:hypothetical protein DSCO28_70900 [Desulfosarcina ovata subsp. sediminis]